MDVDARTDEVVLRSGGFVRGTLAEVRPGSHVVITPQTGGEAERIAWSELTEVRRGNPSPRDEPAPPPGPPPIPTTPPPVEPTTGPGNPHVHIDSVTGKTVVLQRISGTISGYNMVGIIHHAVCRSPCDAVVDGRDGARFFVTGDGVSPSRAFTLTDDTGALDLEVKTGSLGLKWTGVMFTGIGAGLLAAGLMFLAIAPSSGLRRSGIGMAIGGGVGLAAGIPMWILGRTTVKKRPRSLARR